MLSLIKILSSLTNSKQSNLAVIYVTYERDTGHDSEEIFKTLQGYLAKIDHCNIAYLKVDNKKENAPLTKCDKNIFTIGGDNRYREFSGWQKGIEHLAEISPDTEVILFANDMFLKPGESFLKDYANKALLDRVLKKGEIIGRIDSTGQKYEAYNYDLSSWVCTNCFLTPRQALEKLGGLVTVKDNIDDFLPLTFPEALRKTDTKPVPADYFQADAPINEAYKNWLVEWLTERWHSRFQPDHKTWGIFRNKVRNILNESLLTARFQDAGFHPTSYGDKKYY